MFDYDLDKIIIYPFGGNTKYHALLNSLIYKELIILIFGFLFQFLFYFLVCILYINNFVNSNNFFIVKQIHYSLILFNILPIIPLDGSKFINLILEYFFSYKKSNIISIFISVLSIIVLLIFNFNLLYIFIAFVLTKSLLIEVYNHKIKFNKFLVERLIYHFNFKKGKILKNIYDIKRNKSHKIISNNKIYEEKEYLENLFDLKH